MDDFYVYALFDWRGVPRYIGKGRGSRIDDHLESDRRANRIKNALIRKTVAMLGDLPRVKHRENLPEGEAFAIEVALIAALGRIDLKTGPLANMSDGGTGGDYGHLISAAKKRWTPEHRAAAGKNRGAAQRRAWLMKSPEEQARLKGILAEARAKARLDPDIEAKRLKGIREGHARRTPEQKADAAQKALLAFPGTLRSERVRAFHASQTPEERSKRVNGSQTIEQRRARAFKAQKALSPANRSARSKLGWKTRTAEEITAHKARAANVGRGTKWITDGTQNRRLREGEELSPGWVYGKIRRSRSPPQGAPT